jgi:glycosyltransferase involved in cell wall biosynthesis
VVTYFGFLYPSKGFREFIQLARRTVDRGIDATFMIVGGAVRGEEFFGTLVGKAALHVGLARNYEVEAARLVHDLGLAACVRFVPFTRETSLYYQASDVVVAPSRGPELGRPVIEAAACGIPVVASGSRTGGGIVVSGTTGVLVPDTDVEVLADAVTDLIEDPERRRSLGAAARRHALEHFEPAANTRRLEAVYRTLVPRRDRIKILYVHHRPQLGGAPASLAELIRNRSDRFEPHVFCPEGPAADLFADAGAVVHTGSVSIFAHPWDNPYEGLRWLVLGRELSALPSHAAQLAALMREHRFPIVHLNDSPLLAAAAVGHAHGARIVWHLRSALAGDGRDRRSRAIVRMMERWGDVAIAIDRDVAARFPIRLPLTIIHNSVRPVTEVDAPGAGKAALGLPPDRVAIGFAGFVRRQKGWPELVEAAEMLLGEDAPVHFVIMGGGVRPPEYFRTLRGRLLESAQVISDDESAIKGSVAGKGLMQHFSFLPFTSATEEVYGALDIVTFPNQGVGLGRPVLEAAMHGKPVVASGSQTGAGVLLPGRTGLLLRDPAPAAIASALRSLIDDAGLRDRLGREAAEHARRHFDPVANTRAVESVYDWLLGGKQGSLEPVLDEAVELVAVSG